MLGLEDWEIYLSLLGMYPLRLQCYHDYIIYLNISIRLQGHARRVVCSEFSPNGFQLATAGDDGTIKIWDLRRRRASASIPAHTNLITQLKFSHSTSSQNGEFLVSSSFDGTGKIWSTRDWKMLTTLQGHEGKVMGIDVLDGPDCAVVTCGFDKTLKLWK